MSDSIYDEAYYTGGRGAYRHYEYNAKWKRRASRLMARFGDARTFLDVACARGFLLRGYVENGVNPEDVYGIDISEWAVAHSESIISHRTRCCSIFDFSPTVRWDLVTAYDFLEHIEKERMQEVVSILEECCGKYLQVVLMISKASWDTDVSHQSIMPLDEWIGYFNLRLHDTETCGHVVTATFERIGE